MKQDEESVTIRAPLPIQKRRAFKRRLTITESERTLTKVSFDIETDILFTFYSAFPDIRLSAFLSEVMYEYLNALKPDKVERLKLSSPAVGATGYVKIETTPMQKLTEKSKVKTARKVIKKKEIERILSDVKNE